MSNWREKLKASTHGEVSREGIDPYRAAGGGVYHYVIELDELRAQADQPNIQAALLAGWVSFALQVLGDEMLDTDAAVDPSTAHFLPKVTAEQAMAFYEQVQPWIARARSAQASAGYSLDVAVPQVLPEWVEVEPCPHAHLMAFREAADRLRQQAEGVLAGFDPGPNRSHARDVVAQALAEANAASDYATGLWASTATAPPANLHEAIEAHLKHAIEVYFYLGQVASMPSLADAPRRARQDAIEQERPASFLETMIRSYPQIAQRRRGGMFSGVGGGLLGGFLGGAVIDQILGGGGGGFGGGGWGNGGGWGDNGGGFF